MTTTDDRSIFALTDEEAFNRVMPRWAQVLAFLYWLTFERIDGFLDHLYSAKTYRLIAKGEYEYDTEIVRDNMDALLKGLVHLDTDDQGVEPDRLAKKRFHEKVVEVLDELIQDRKRTSSELVEPDPFKP